MDRSTKIQLSKILDSMNKEISDLYRYIENYSQDIIYLISDINPDFNYLIDNFSKDNNKCFVKEKKS